MNGISSAVTKQRFRDKVAIVTGAAGGIGQAVVAHLADHGARVVAVDRDETAMAPDVLRFAGRVVAVGADVSREADCDHYVHRAVERFGSVDCFVNNAGVVGASYAIADMPVEAFDDVIAVNLRGVFLGLRAVLRQMIAQGRGGAIVNTSSMAALRSRPERSAYGASKRGVIALSNSAALEYAAQGIRVNAICPGVVDTPMTQAFTAQFPAFVGAIPLGRAAAPIEIATFIGYLLSDEASYQTGGVYTIDGGMVV